MEEIYALVYVILSGVIQASVHVDVLKILVMALPIVFQNIVRQLVHLAVALHHALEEHVILTAIRSAHQLNIV